MTPAVRAIGWWELRRIPYNLALLFIGGVSLVLLYHVSANQLQRGEDLVEPLTVIAYAFMANVCYTLGWLTELKSPRDHSSRNELWKTGTLFSCALTAIPGLISGLLLLVKVVRR